MATTIRPPYPLFFEEDGRPVEGGHVYIGVSGLNPISNPLTCYYDQAMTIPAAAKDIRISGGYIVYKGAPRNLYVPGDYSLLVQDKNGRTIYSSLVNTAENADLLLTLPRGMMARAMRVPLSYNMNAILESGFYSWTNGGTSNFPAGCAAADLYALQVQAAPDGAGIIYQRLVDFTTGPTSALYTFERQSVNAGIAWTAWIATNVPSGYGTGWQTALSSIFTSQVALPEDPRGLTCSNAADADHDITISAGGAADSTRVIWLALASAITKQIDAAWAAGTNSGGLFSGAVAANTVYYVWLIRKDSDGSIDAGFDIDITGANAPAGYTYKRRIMTVCTDASANIIPTDQTGDTVEYIDPIFDRIDNSAIGNTNRNAYTITAPPNMPAIIALNSHILSGSELHLWYGTSARTNTAASYTYTDFYAYSGSITAIINPKLDASRQFYVRLSNTNASLGFATRGWIDDRGRNA
jgi:hypothetical protein